MTKITDENKAHSFHIGLCFSKSHKIVIWMKRLKKTKQKPIKQTKSEGQKQSKKFHPIAN